MGSQAWRPQCKQSTAKTAELPDERHILSSRLKTPTAADFLSSTPPLSLSVNEAANRLGAFLPNWNLLTTEKWILQAVSRYKVPFFRPPHQWQTAHGANKGGDLVSYFQRMKLDLKDAYYAVQIHPESKKYLSFHFKGTTYDFFCLPFGLSLAPRVFTRILRPIAANLRLEGIRTVIYLDDLLLIHHQKDTLREVFPYGRRLLSNQGFKVKLEKCSLEPTRRLVFLGTVLDTTYMSVALPEEHINRIQGACQEMLESQKTSLGGLLSLSGRMSHAARTGLWIPPLYYRALQRQQTQLLHRFGWRPRCQMFELNYISPVR